MRLVASALCAASAIAVSSGSLAAPPAPPVISEPVAGQVVHPADVHMVTRPFSDPDGDEHLCSDWELRHLAAAGAGERAWAVSCIRGAEKVHIHLGDGLFEGSHAGRSSLLPEASYRLRVRFQDTSGEWSDWAELEFRTSALSRLPSLRLAGVALLPPPDWSLAVGGAVRLPAGEPPPFLRLEGSGGEKLLEISGTAADRSRVDIAPPLDGHVEVRLELGAGGAAGGLELRESDLAFLDTAGAARTIYLPATRLARGETLRFWVSASGSTYLLDPERPEPDFANPARGSPLPWPVQQPGFRLELFATGFLFPVNIAFVPSPGERPEDPFLYVTELYGAIKVVRRNGAVSDYASDLLDFTPSGIFPGSGEQGVAGIAIEAASGDIFASLVYKPQPAADYVYARVVRFHSEDGGLTAASQRTVIDMAGERLGASHQVSSVSFGPDGKLYVHVGDGESPAAAQDLDSFRGKILRLELDGSAPADNPFFDPADGITARDYVYAYGFRNPFGGAWRAAGGALFEVENGPSVDRLAKVERGRNYLYDGSNDSMRSYAAHAWAPAASPVNIVFIEAETFNGSGFPAGKLGHAFVPPVPLPRGPAAGAGARVRGDPRLPGCLPLKRRGATRHPRRRSRSSRSSSRPRSDRPSARASTTSRG
jgi:glucose/arabinose dehydrogenase